MSDESRITKEKTYWNKLSENYDKLILKYWNIYKTELLGKVVSNVNSEAVVIDVACGTGLISESLSAKSKQVVGVDMSENMIAQANIKKKEKGLDNISYKVEDAYNLSFDENKYDIAVCVNALHNMQQPEKALSEMKRVLKPGGKLIISIVGLGTSFKVKAIFSIMNFFQKTPLPAFHKLNLNQAVELVKNAGFEIASSELLKDDKDMMPLLFIIATH